MFTPYDVYFEDYDGTALTGVLKCQFDVSGETIVGADGGQTFQQVCNVMVQDELASVVIGNYMVVTHETGRLLGSWEISGIIPKDLKGGFHHSFIKGKKAV